MPKIVDNFVSVKVVLSLRKKSYNCVKLYLSHILKIRNANFPNVLYVIDNLLYVHIIVDSNI